MAKPKSVDEAVVPWTWCTEHRQFEIRGSDHRRVSVEEDLPKWTEHQRTSFWNDRDAQKRFSKAMDCECCGRIISSPGRECHNCWEVRSRVQGMGPALIKKILRQAGKWPI